MPDDILQRVLEAFQQEHREHLAAIRAMLVRWPQLAKEELEEAFRMAHSLKGGARVCDLTTVEKLTHHLEQDFAGILRGQQPATPEAKAEIEHILAAVEDYMSALAEQRPPVEPVALLQQLKIIPPASVAAPPPAPVPAPPAAETGPRPTAPPGAETVRVNAGHLDRLLRSSTRLLAETIRQSQTGDELQEITHALESITKKTEQSAAPENQATSNEELRSSLLAVTRLTRRLLSEQRKGSHTMRLLGEQLQGEVRQARMVPIGSVLEGFPKMVRDLAREEGKEIAFFASGLDREADRLVLQALKDPVMHALRNAVSHGIETPEERLRASKPVEGQLRLTTEIRGNRLCLAIRDDGRGLDAAAITTTAVKNGIITPEESLALSPADLYALLFQPGFSTRGTVTTTSGRGMGLSVVRETVARLQGAVHLAPAADGGTELIIETPVTAATHRLVLVRSADATYAFPALAINRLLRLPASSLQHLEGKTHVIVEGQAILFASLGAVFGTGDVSLSTAGGLVRTAIIKSGPRQLAIGVDDFLREVNLLVAPLPFPADQSPFFSGAIALENGESALVIDPGALLDRFKGAMLQQRVAPEAAPVKRKATVLVVDDSFTARTLQKNILETAGYDVKVAVDGAQGLAALRASSFDAVVADVQMPRMDGFQMLEAIKRDERLQQIPVVMVTSLNSDSDRTRGLSLGASAYIIKQKFDHQELLEVVQQLI